MPCGSNFLYTSVYGSWKMWNENFEQSYVLAFIEALLPLEYFLVHPLIHLKNDYDSYVMALEKFKYAVYREVLLSGCISMKIRQWEQIFYGPVPNCQFKYYL